MTAVHAWSDATDEIERLRGILKEILQESHGWWDDDAERAIMGLARIPDESAWVPIADCAGPASITNRMHFVDTDGERTIDQVDFDADGRIECKHGCGLWFHVDCQPAVFTPDVVEILKEFDRPTPTEAEA
jgi:hypothetical protein